MVALATPIFTIFNQGQVASGAKVYTYISGGTTPLTTYSDSGLTTPNTNPITADANGQVTIYANTTNNIRLDLYTSDGAFIRTVDPVYPAAFATGGSGGTEATIASSATTDLGSAGVNVIKVTGTTSITSFGSSASVSNPIYYVRFTGALTITNSANIVCPGGSNITTASGSAMIVQYLGSGIWQVLILQSASGGSYLQVSNNLSDVGSAATARNNIMPSQTSNASKFLTTDGTNMSWGTPPGILVQQQSATTASTLTGVTAIPYDDTIPQITEGDEYLTVSITPTNASNKLEISGFFLFGEDANNDYTGTLALFQDSTANALFATSFGTDIIISPSTTATCNPVYFVHRMTAGTTSATTFRVRAGWSTSSTLRLNGAAGGRKYGGVSASWLTVKEMTQ